MPFTKSGETKNEIVTEHVEGLPDAGNADIISVSQIEVSKDVGPPSLRREHLHGRQLFLAFLGWLMTEFMGGMGGNMLSPAIPVIASQFDALGQIGWVSGAYYMTQCGSMLLFGQCSQIFDTKYVLISAIFIFMLGSTISGGAQGTIALIVGRGVAGIGSAGCYITVQTLLAFLVDLEYRPAIWGSFGLANAVSCTAGPIIAGSFASHGLWRMSFLLVLPLGTLAIILNLFVTPSVPPLEIDDHMDARLDQQIKFFTRASIEVKNKRTRQWLLADWLGFFVVTSSLICLVLALTWGGAMYAWKSSHVIGCFIGFAAIMALFLWMQTRVPWPLMPLRGFRNRTLIGACMMAFFCFMSNLMAAVYLPVLYEAARDVNSLQAGIHLIPFLMTIIIAQMVQGFILKFWHRYKYWAFTCPSIIAVGAGLLYTVSPGTTNAQLIGFQIIYGLGIGLTQGLPMLAVQADNKEADVPSSLSSLAFLQLFGGMCGPVIGSAILNDGLQRYLPANGVDSETMAAVIASVENIWSLEGEVKQQVVQAYLDALSNCFIAAVPFAVIVICGGLIIRNRTLAGNEI